MKTFVTGEGARIAYSDEGVGRPLVLLHGLMAHSGFFESQRPLVERFRLIRVDLAGHGESSRDGELTIARLAEDVVRLVEHLDIEDAIGVGWSLGASVLWRMLAGPASHRFAGAVVIDMTPRVMNDSSWQLGLSPETCAARSEAMAQDFEAFATGAGAAIFAQPLSDETRPLAEWAAREFARNDSDAIAALWESLASDDLRPRLGGIAQPTLVVHGAQSHLYGADTADHLVAALPSARAVRFECSGHAPHLEEADRFNALLSEFAASLPPVPQPQTIECQE